MPVVGDDGQLDTALSVDQVSVDGAEGFSQLGWRQRLYGYGRRQGLSFARVVHPAAIIGGDRKLQEGSSVMAAAVLQPRIRACTNVVINTGARLDHHCDSAEHASVGPGALGTRYVGEGELVMENPATARTGEHA